MEGKHSKGQWNLETTMSSDMEFIRRIANDEGVIAKVCRREDQSQEEALANALVMVCAKEMLEALVTVEKMLSEHPESGQGNSKIHYLMHLARTRVEEATGKVKRHWKE